MKPHYCAGLDGMPTILCFDWRTYALMLEWRAFIERMSRGAVRIGLVVL